VLDAAMGAPIESRALKGLALFMDGSREYTACGIGKTRGRAPRLDNSALLLKGSNS
jgi:hypothetical protein